MMLSKETYDNLDIDYIKERVNVFTPYGVQMKKKLRPLGPNQMDVIQSCFDETEVILGLIEKQRYTLTELRNYFKHVTDLTGTFNRLAAGEVLSTTELFEIKSLVIMMRRMVALLEEKVLPKLPEHATIRPMPEIESLLDPEALGVNTFYIYDGYSKRLSEIRKDMKAVEHLITKIKKDQKVLVEETHGVKVRLNGEIIVKKEEKDLLKQLNDSSLLHYSAETYMTVTYVIRGTEEMDRLEEQITELKREEEAEEYVVRKNLSQKLMDDLEALKDNCIRIGALDLLLARGYYAKGIEGVKPTLLQEDVLEIEDGRHLKIAFNHRAEKKPYTPVSIALKKGVSCVTGANMGGKTVTLRMVGMLTAMAQMGLYVPATSMAFSPRNFIYISVGDDQSTDKGLSTFGAEIEHMKDVISMADLRGLILVDELASGTNPKEGYAISKAIINYLKAKNSMTVITTHFDGLADDEDVCHFQVRGLSDVDFDALLLELKSDEDLGMNRIHEYMDYRLKIIHSNEEVPKDAINISRLMGLDHEILEDAKNILSSFKEGRR
ncbi:MAG: DNA mismatch repair protein MutS [Clostridia bacterium]|nr:DNA mismatch repair protein MutS [Clostridia bacterium]